MYDGGSADDLTVLWNPLQNRNATVILEEFYKTITLESIEPVSLKTIFSQEDERIHQIVVSAQDRAREQIGKYDPADRDLNASELSALWKRKDANESMAYKIWENLVGQASTIPNFKQGDANFSAQEQRAYQIWDQLRR
ncbi:MAG: hypothetical protein KDJ75_09740 [Alphaproteobacteria bacterium]|nr:hypothetical protein [Alphaproteobacteria bacterium]